MPCCLRLHPSLVALHLLFACLRTDDAAAEVTPRVAPAAADAQWHTDFFDDFDRFEPDNWQDQLLWVNDEQQCYVRDGQHQTRVVSDGTLKLRVVDLGTPVACGNLDKQGNAHPPTQYVAGRIASKNRREFVKGRWTARIRVQDSGQSGMFPAWWLLGARNNEPPVEDADENVCWPLVGSGEIDIFEHHSDGGPDHYAARAIRSTGVCGSGDWRALMHVQAVPLADFHEYGVEWDGADLVFQLDGKEIHRSVGQGDQLPEPFFAILNFAKINPSSMTTPAWTMEVDWVKHERVGRQAGRDGESQVKTPIP
jgi:beta-glucanase (GH16 family)